MIPKKYQAEYTKLKLMEELKAKRDPSYVPKQITLELLERGKKKRTKEAEAKDEEYEPPEETAPRTEKSERRERRERERDREAGESGERPERSRGRSKNEAANEGTKIQIAIPMEGANE